MEFFRESRLKTAPISEIMAEMAKEEWNRMSSTAIFILRVQNFLRARPAE